MENLRSSRITFGQTTILFKKHTLANQTLARKYVAYSIMKSCIENLYDVRWTFKLWKKSFWILHSLCWKANWVFRKLKIVIGFPCWGDESKIRKSKMQFNCHYCFPFKNRGRTAINLHKESPCRNYATKPILSRSLRRNSWRSYIFKSKKIVTAKQLGCV